MSFKSITFAAAIAATLFGTMAIATDSAFANEMNQVTSQDCGDKLEPSDAGCQNVASQIQGNEHAISLASQQTFEVEKEENTPAEATASQQSITPSIVLPH